MSLSHHVYLSNRQNDFARMVEHQRGLTLPEALHEVGPGWAPLVHELFEMASEVSGTRVTRVGQESGHFDAALLHPDGMEKTREVFGKRLADLRERSRHVCEGCGAGGSVSKDAPRRTHCTSCRIRWQELGCIDRALWMERSGQGRAD